MLAAVGMACSGPPKPGCRNALRRDPWGTFDFSISILVCDDAALVQVKEDGAIQYGREDPGRKSKWSSEVRETEDKWQKEKSGINKRAHPSKEEDDMDKIKLPGESRELHGEPADDQEEATTDGQIEESWMTT
ncbi:hypothetical protein NDU88_009979 [Pleurodeles waltl]|uniref:Uncharacterized protein n=1 Tax=Pleurodeles waltl TaxID=8319 RepID=A0AAV7S197_PLEWA|nr:hypothetical protein NDU88_009979 [Pleurodeles waltl]